MRPLLKWAGGKRQLLSRLEEYYPLQFSRFVEPFVGSGAVFFHLFGTGRLMGRSAQLCDMNPDLIGCYRALRDRTDEVIAELLALEREHRSRGDACYYEVRNNRFNPRRAALLAEARDPETAASAYPVSLAAMFIFLNRTGFNGLYRLNRHGEFNVPAGRYVAPTICDVPHLRQVALAFQAPGVHIDHRSFDVTLAGAGKGDFVYCDPPYAPLSRTASFASYTAAGFTPFDQHRLQQALIAACGRGAHVVMSNSSAPEILAAYRTAEARRAGLTTRLVPARRSINSRAAARGPVNEVIVTNVRPPKLRMARATTAGARLRVRSA